MPQFKVVSEYTPSGDQPQAIEKLAEGLENGLRQQVLLGVTGSGKTYTMAKVIEKVQRPTLVLAHNKTLAAQLCEEFREFFPENAVEYFVSYYDYYQPEAYIPHTDTFIEKDAAINAEIERLRHSATAALFERRDVIVVASVSCIYGLGDPDRLRQYGHLPAAGARSTRGISCCGSWWRSATTATMWPSSAICSGSGGTRWRFTRCTPTDYAIRVEFFGDEIDRICGDQPRHRSGPAGAAARGHLPRQPLRHHQGEDGAGGAGDRAGAGGAQGLLRGSRQAHGGPAHRPAHPLRRGDDAGVGLLHRHRELQPGHLRPGAGFPAHHAAGLLPGGLCPFCGREPCDPAAGAGHVQRRPGQEGEFGGVRLPPALRL